MAYKKQMTPEGLPLSCEDAVFLCDVFERGTKQVKDAACTEKDELVYEALEVLQQVQYNIIKEKLRIELQ